MNRAELENLIRDKKIKVEKLEKEILDIDLVISRIENKLPQKERDLDNKTREYIEMNRLLCENNLIENQRRRTTEELNKFSELDRACKNNSNERRV